MGEREGGGRESWLERERESSVREWGERVGREKGAREKKE